MKIDVMDRIRESVESEKDQVVQIEEAKASGRPFGIATDCATGKKAVFFYTKEEIAHMTAFKDVTVKRKKAWRQELDDLKAALKMV